MELFLGRETLGVEPEPAEAPHRPGVLAALFAPEALPEDPVPPPPRASVVRTLFAPEPISDLPEISPPPRRSAWLRWLFRFERLDPP